MNCDCCDIFSIEIEQNVDTDPITEEDLKITLDNIIGILPSEGSLTFEEFKTNMISAIQDGLFQNDEINTDNIENVELNDDSIGDEETDANNAEFIPENVIQLFRGIAYDNDSNKRLFLNIKDELDCYSIIGGVNMHYNCFLRFLRDSVSDNTIQT
ncbi:hypothetical protein OAF54_03705, partial [bacterium]|nr:hypothetical protein [bacterium]